MSTTTYFGPTTRQVARALVDGGAYQFTTSPDQKDWWTWKSGLLAPVYCNNRRLLAQPGERGVVADAMQRCVETHLADEVDAVVGLADAGIPWSSTIADRLTKAAYFVRKAPKEHGAELGKVVVPEPEPGKPHRGLVVDDLMASGGTVVAAIDQLRQAGIMTIAVVTIVNWNFMAMQECFSALGIPVFALVGYEHLLDEAHARGQLGRRLTDHLLDFYKNPVAHAWDPRRFGEGASGAAVAS